MHLPCPHCQAINRLVPERLAEQPVCGRCKTPLFQGKPVELDGPGLERQIARSDLPLLVDFWAPWCGPCRMMAPAFVDAARELEPHFRLAKLDTERHPDAGGRYRIRSIPTLILFQAGREVGRQSGALSLAQIVQWARTQV